LNTVARNKNVEAVNDAPLPQVPPFPSSPLPTATPESLPSPPLSSSLPLPSSPLPPIPLSAPIQSPSSVALSSTETTATSATLSAADADAPVPPNPASSVPSSEAAPVSPNPAAGVPAPAAPRVTGVSAVPAVSGPAAASSSKQLILVFGAIVIGVLVVAGAVFAIFSGKEADSVSRASTFSRGAGSPASISSSEIEKAFNADSLSHELSKALTRQDWETAAQTWVKLLAADGDAAERRKSEVLPRIQENLIAALCARFEGQAKKLQDKKSFKFETAQKNREELKNAVKLANAIGTKTNAATQQRFDILGTYFDLLVCKGEKAPVDVVLLAANSPLPRINAPRSLLGEHRGKKKPHGADIVTVPVWLFDSFSRFISRGTYFVLYPESEGDVAQGYPDAKQGKKGANQISAVRVTGIRKEVLEKLRNQKSTQAEALQQETQTRIHAIAGRPSFDPQSKAPFLDQPAAWVLAVSDGKTLTPLVRFK
jgi:hypothetical protein